MSLRRVFVCCLGALVLLCCAACAQQPTTIQAPVLVPIQMPAPQPELDMEPELEPVDVFETCEEIWFFGCRTTIYASQEQQWLRLNDVQASLPQGLTLDPSPLETVTADNQRYGLLAQIAEQLALEWGQAPDGLRYLARRQTLGEIPEGYNVPVLMYHAVSDEMWGFQELFVSPGSMEQQLQYLQENGYQTIWFSDLDHIEDYEKPVILTFDDGYDDNYTELYPLLEKYQAKATIFVIGSGMGTSHKMTREQVHELAASGLVSIQSHTYTHGNLSAMDEQTLRQEMEQSNAVLAAATGQIPYVLCFPEGKYSDLTVQVAKDYYSFSLLMNGWVYQTGMDPYRVPRSYIPRSLTVGDFAWSVKAAGKAK